MDPLVGLESNFRKKIVENHQIPVFPRQSFLVDGDIGDVVDVILFRSGLQKAFPSGLGKSLVVG